ncbi:ribosomal protein S12 methylthiotransferase, partial [Candidatus Gastranaerophilus sp. (ex Termes propinquus)]
MENSSEKNVAIIQHGCSKNLVDTELMIGFLANAGYSVTLDPDEAKTVVVSTCSFIHDAEKESVRSILEMVEAGKRVVVAGCLPQKHKEELKAAIPEIAAFLGTCDFDKIVDAIEAQDYYFNVSEEPNYRYPENVERKHITVGSSAYLKIADGCNFSCGYCIIPTLRGKYNSRSMEDILAEAKRLAEMGVSEIILIAQDTTSWGLDIYSKPSLAKLLCELNKIEELDWIRVLYTYPTYFNDELLEAFKSLDKVVKYIDMPLQHSDPEILKMMKRPPIDCEELVLRIRAAVSDVTLRTTLIVGYPGENDEHFANLYNFVKKMRFDRLGVFEFSRERGTYAYSLKNQVSASVKKRRKKQILALQEKISKEVNESFI